MPGKPLLKKRISPDPFQKTFLYGDGIKFILKTAFAARQIFHIPEGNISLREAEFHPTKSDFTAPQVQSPVHPRAEDSL